MTPHPRHRAPWYFWPYELVGLTGSDGRPSFVKIVIVSVVASYYFKTPIPLGVAGLVVGASYGYKGFRDFLTRGSWVAREVSTAAGTAQKVESVTHSVGETPAPAPEDGTP